MLSEQVGALLERRVRVQEDDALRLKVVASLAFSASGIPRRSYVFLMSSGSSSQEAAGLSVERTKYLYSSKSMNDRSGPHAGIGRRSKSLRALRRFLSIHSGSFFTEEM